MNDDLRTLLQQDETKRNEDIGGSTLKVLIVDDEPTVHDITALVLKNFQYKNYRLELLSAYSASEAREILATQGPFALVLLDVIMETDDAGLTLARYIREELKDPMVRIILRTGQPGMVPQRQVMREYEIDDYKEKAELTSERFDATVTASIRTYLGFQSLEQSRRGLVRILDAIRDIETTEAEETIANHILDQIETVMDRTRMNGTGSLLIAADGNSGERIIAGRGEYEALKDLGLDSIENSKAKSLIRETLTSGKTHQDLHCIMTTLLTRDGGRYLAYFEDVREFGDVERYLVELYSSHVKVSLDNKMLTKELVETQKEIIATLGEVIESRSGETGLHVQRVGELSRMIAEEIGFEAERKELLLFAAPLHDIGKVGIKDVILNKPGKLTPEEFEVMKTHTQIGYDILKTSQRHVLKMGADICLQHHERWDGNGYPKGIADEDICIEARICSIADVLDALRSKRVYKDPVPLDEALMIIQNGRGSQFDPRLVDVLMDNKDKVKAIYSTLKDA